MPWVQLNAGRGTIKCNFGTSPAGWLTRPEIPAAQVNARSAAVRAAAIKVDDLVAQGRFTAALFWPHLRAEMVAALPGKICR